MKAKVLIFLVLYVAMAAYSILSLIDEVKAPEMRWLWVALFAVVGIVSVVRCVQLTRDLMRLIKEEKE